MQVAKSEILGRGRNDSCPNERAMIVSISTGLPSFDPLDRMTLQAQAYQQLRKALMGGVFKPGTVITIRAAAEALGTSPMPVRAALQRLEAEGALVARGSKRTLEIPALSRDEYLELRDIRVQLDGLAAERAAANVTPVDVDNIETLCQAMQDAAEAGSLDDYVRTNWDFHLAICRASRMETLVSLIESLWLRIGPYVPLMMPDRESMVASMPAHWRAVEALRRQDGVAARAAIADDLTNSGAKLMTQLRPGSEPAV